MNITRAPVLASLTGIRFIAAALVFNAHLGNVPGRPDVLATLSEAGRDGMTMFFILSGLILTWNYDEILGTRLTGHGLRVYFVARFARIYPLYLFTLAFIALSRVTFFPADLWYLLQDPKLWAQVFAVQTWSGDIAVAYGYNGPSWSVGVELFLYALFPLLIVPFRAIRSNPRALSIVAAACVAVSFALVIGSFLLGTADLPIDDSASAHRWLYRTPLTRIPDFVLGISLGYLMIATRGRDFVKPGRAIQAVGGVAAIAMMLIPPLVFSIWSLDATNMIPFGLLFLGLVWAPDTVLARFLASRLMVILGASSYAFYLWHQTIINLIVRTDVASTTTWVVTWVVAFLLTTVVAVGAHLLVERPARTWLRRKLAGQGPPSTELRPAV